MPVGEPHIQLYDLCGFDVAAKRLKEPEQLGKRGKSDSPGLALGVDNIRFELAIQKNDVT
jgi:hypothetical protein